MSETEAEPEPVSEPGSPPETQPTPSLPQEEPGPPARGPPAALPDGRGRGGRHVMHERPPWEADVPLHALAAAPWPKLVVSGDHSPAFETLCDVIAERIGA